MGRVARYKKIKTFDDPKEHLRDQPPTSSHDKPSRAFHELVAATEKLDKQRQQKAELKKAKAKKGRNGANQTQATKAAKHGKSTTSSKQGSTQHAPSLVIGQNETLSEFNARVDSEYAGYLQQGYSKLTKKSQKKKKISG